MGIGLEIFSLLLLIVIVALIVIWCKEFILMMALGDSDYPGRYDKTLWFITFIIFSIVAPFLFRGWKKLSIPGKY